MTEELFPIVTHDVDRERIRARARLTRDVLADLEEAALSAASRHTHQIDALKTELAAATIERDAAVAEAWRLVAVDDIAKSLKDELAEAQRQLATPSLPFPSSMAVGLDDIRTILAEETHTTVQELLVIEDGQVQVVDSLHQLLAHIIAVATAWPDGETESLRKSLAWTQEELAKSKAAHIASIKGATDNADADADMWDEEITTLTAKVRALAEAIRPVNGAADVAGVIDVVAQAVTELAGQIADGGKGEAMKALALEQANANQIETELQAIETICESRGMPATCERVDIPAWLAEQLTARVEKKAKAKRKAKTIPADDIGEGEVGDE